MPLIKEGIDLLVSWVQFLIAIDREDWCFTRWCKHWWWILFFL